MKQLSRVYREAGFAPEAAGITGFSDIGLNSTDSARDERFWTEVCNAHVSDRIGYSVDPRQCDPSNYCAGARAEGRHSAHRPP
jgi:hypothetical protein